ncbi:MAG: CBS domain-containing protein [Cyclobacteriaceae bacterium]
MKNATISEIMSRQVQKLTTNDDVIDAKRIMDDHNISHVPIMRDGQLAGIVSNNDIAQIEYLCDFIGEKLERSTIFKSLSIHEIMTKDVVSLSSTAKISEAVLVFSNVSFHSLPVVDNGELVGIVTAKDVFRFLSLV